MGSHVLYVFHSDYWSPNRGMLMLLCKLLSKLHLFREAETKMKQRQRKV